MKHNQEKQQTVQDAILRLGCHRLDHEYVIGFKSLELIDAALNLLADIEAGKVRVVLVRATDGMIGIAYSKKHTAWQSGHSNCELYKAIIKEAPPHPAETYLKGLK